MGPRSAPLQAGSSDARASEAEGTGPAGRGGQACSGTQGVRARVMWEAGQGHSPERSRAGPARTRELRAQLPRWDPGGDESIVLQDRRTPRTRPPPHGSSCVFSTGPGDRQGTAAPAPQPGKNERGSPGWPRAAAEPRPGTLPWVQAARTGHTWPAPAGAAGRRVGLRLPCGFSQNRGPFQGTGRSPSASHAAPDPAPSRTGWDRLPWGSREVGLGPVCPRPPGQACPAPPRCGISTSSE